MILSQLPAVCLSPLYSFFDLHGLSTLRQVSSELKAASRYATAWSRAWEHRFSILQPTNKECEEAIACRKAEKEKASNPDVKKNQRSIHTINVLAASQRAFLLQYARVSLGKFLTIGQYTYPVTYVEKEVPTAILRDDEIPLPASEQSLYQSVYDRLHSRHLTTSQTAAEDRKRELMQELLQGSTHWWSPLLMFTNVEQLEFDSDLVSGRVMQMLADFMPHLRHLELRTHVDGRKLHIQLDAARFFPSLGRMEHLEFLRIPNKFLRKWNETTKDGVGAFQYLSHTAVALSLRHICFSVSDRDRSQREYEPPSALFKDDLFWLGKFATLTQIDLSEAGVLGDALFAQLLAAIPSLQSMDLRCSSSLTDSVLGAVVALPQLNFLDLTCCYSLSRASIAFIARCTSLTKLVLSCVSFKGDTMALVGLSPLHQLTSLDASGAKMSNAVLTSGAWDHLTHLRRLKVQFCQLSQPALERLCEVIHASIEYLAITVDGSKEEEEEEEEEEEKGPEAEISEDSAPIKLNGEDVAISFACLNRCGSLTNLTLGWGESWNDKATDRPLSFASLRTLFSLPPPRLLALHLENKFEWSRELSEQLVSAGSRIGRLAFSMYGSSGKLLTPADFLPLVNMSTLVEIEFYGNSDGVIAIAQRVSDAQSLSNLQRFCRVIVPRKTESLWD